MFPIRLLATASMIGWLVMPARADDAMLALASHKACMACHRVDTKVVGPAFQDVAARYEGQANAASHLANQIRTGSQGVWGTIPMPPNSTVTEDEAAKLANWILEQVQ